MAKPMAKTAEERTSFDAELRESGKTPQEYCSERGVLYNAYRAAIQRRKESGNEKSVNFVQVGQLQYVSELRLFAT